MNWAELFFKTIIERLLLPGLIKKALPMPKALTFRIYWKKASKEKGSLSFAHQAREITLLYPNR